MHLHHDSSWLPARYKRAISTDGITRKSLEPFAKQLVNSELHMITGLTDTDLEELQTEMTQFPLVELLKLDKKDQTELIDDCFSFISTFLQSGEVSAVAKEALEQCQAVVKPDSVDVGVLNSAITAVKRNAALPKPSPGVHDPHSIHRAIHSFNQVGPQHLTVLSLLTSRLC